jgi:hypothetical protein
MIHAWSAVNTVSVCAYVTSYEVLTSPQDEVVLISHSTYLLSCVPAYARVQSLQLLAANKARVSEHLLKKKGNPLHLSTPCNRHNLHVCRRLCRHAYRIQSHVQSHVSLLLQDIHSSDSHLSQSSCFRCCSCVYSYAVHSIHARPFVERAPLTARAHSTSFRVMHTVAACACVSPSSVRCLGFGTLSG